jgi:hypothetical protein
MRSRSLAEDDLGNVNESTAFGMLERFIVILFACSKYIVPWSFQSLLMNLSQHKLALCAQMEWPHAPHCASLTSFRRVHRGHAHGSCR